MARAGFCDQCGENVWLAPDGSCPRGHGAEHVSGVYEVAEPTPAPQPAPAPGPYQPTPAPAPYQPGPAGYAPQPGQYAPAPAPRGSNRGVIIAVVAVVLVGMLFICGILAAIAIPIFSASKNSAQQKTCFANERTIVGAAEVWEADKGTPAPSIRALLDENLLNTWPTCPAGGTYAWDPKTHHVSCSVHGSYQSSDASGGSGSDSSTDESATP